MLPPQSRPGCQKSVAFFVIPQAAAGGSLLWKSPATSLGSLSQLHSTQPMLTFPGTSEYHVPLTTLQSTACCSPAEESAPQSVLSFSCLFLLVLRLCGAVQSGTWVRCSHPCMSRMNPAPWAPECWSRYHEIWNLFQVAERGLAVPMTFNKTPVCPGSVGTKGNHPLLPIRSPAEQPGPDCQPGS